MNDLIKVGLYVLFIRKKSTVEALTWYKNLAASNNNYRRLILQCNAERFIILQFVSIEEKILNIKRETLITIRGFKVTRLNVRER